MSLQVQSPSRPQSGSVNSVRSQATASKRLQPSIEPTVQPSWNEAPFSLDQELVPFGTWTSKPIWVPPKDSSRELAKTILDKCGLLASRETCWSAAIAEHRSTFTQVREIELPQASIRLPKGRLFVSVTEQADFDKITDKVPNCVRTRLDEFLQGPGRRLGTKVYYLKPLCVEVGDKLIFTTNEELSATIGNIQNEVFSHYRRMALPHTANKCLLHAADLALAVPRAIVKARRDQAKRKVDAYQAQLEFNRRKLALRATNLHRKWRTDGCEFDDMLALTNPLEREDVVEQYGIEHELSKAERDQLLKLSSISLPWFIAVPLALYYISQVTVTLAPPVALCDPAFVAEMPGSKGVVLKIGHFDEIAGVTHVEI